jgi:hypothetical protein
MNGEFSLKRFYRKLRIPRDERKLIRKLMTEGLVEYYHDLYGYHKYGQNPDFLINERMGEPQIFGYGTVQILHHQDVSEQTKRKVAEYTLDITRPDVEFGVPYGLLVVISYLASNGHLRGQQLASALRNLTAEQRIFVDSTQEDVHALVDSLLTDRSLSQEERLDLLYFLLIRCQYAFARGKEILERTLDSPALTQDQKQTLCTQLIEGREDPRQKSIKLLEALSGANRPAGFKGLTTAMVGLVPDYLKRHAIVGLAQLADDPAAVARRYFGTGERYDAVPFDEAVADIIDEFHADMDASEVREMVEEGTQASKLQIRKRFYRLGLKLYGPAFIRPALDDRSKKVRNWASKQLSEK